MANVSYLKDAFRPNLNPELYRIERSTRVETVLRKHKLISGRGDGMKRNCKFMVALGRDNFLLEKDWKKRLKPDDQLIIIRLPEQNLQLHGGGGSNPLRLILQVALLVAAVYAPYLAFNAGLIASATGVAGSLLSAGVLLVGNLALNALMPIKPANIGGGGAAQGNQINMISSQNNVANLHGPKPVMYGRRRVYPNLAAMPYVESSNNEMYLHQLMCITQGKIDVEQVFIESTPIDNFQEAEYQIVPPGGEVTLFNDNVYTAPEVQGLELKKATSGGADIIGYRLVTTQTQVGTDSFDRPIYEYEYHYTPVYGTINWFGGYTATPAGTKTTRLSVDLFWPSGLAYMNDEGDINGASTDIIVQARKIDDKGNPLDDWQTLTGSPDLNDFTGVGRPGGFSWVKSLNTQPLSTRISMATRDQQVRTLYFNVAEGRYQVRMARTDTGRDATKTIDLLQWVGLRSYLPSVRRYADVTMLAVKIRGTNNLNNQIQRRINVVGTRILPVWDGLEWHEQPTRSIAWAAVDILKNEVYGRKLPDRRINLAEALRLDVVWSGRNDYCDGVFEQETTTWDALTTVLMCGRAKPVYYMGIIDFFRNEPRQLPSAVFTPSNMIEGSFGVEYLFHKQDAHDHVIVEYMDPDSWAVKEVECILPGGATRKALKVQMPFITNRNHAWREGIFLAASLLVQRSFPNFTTDRDGMIPRFGDKLLINHDVPNWGGSGNVDTIENNVITTSEPLDWQDGQNHVIKLRGKKGQLLGSYPITRIDEYSGLATGLPDMSEIFSHEPTYYVFGTTERCGMEVTMLTATPDSSEQVAITTVNYSDYPHTVENNLAPPPAPPQTGELTTNLTINQMAVSPSLVENVFRIDVNTAAGASNYDFSYSADGGVTWVDLGSSSSPSITTDDLAFGNIKLRARATTSLFAGNWHVQDEFIEEIVHVGSDIPPLLAVEVVPAVNGLPVYVNITLTGTEIPDVEIYMVEENGVIIYTGYVTSGQPFTFQRQYAPGSGVINFVAYGVDKYDQNSATATQQVTV